MSIANEIKSFYTETNKETGDEVVDKNLMMIEAEEKGEVTQDWDNESTEFDFADGSVLIVSAGNVSAYGSR